MEQRRGRPILPLQRRPITLGEILMREEMREEMRQPAPRPMGRIMSPTRRLGPLANGRPRRPRGRAMSRPSTSAGPSEEDTQNRRRRAPSAPVSTPRLPRWRSTTAEGRMQNIYGVGNGGRYVRRRGITRTTRTRQNRSPDLFYVPFGWQRNSASGRMAHSRSRANTNSGPRSGRFLGGRQRLQRHSRNIDVYDSHSMNRTAPYRSIFRSGAMAGAHSHFLRSTGRPRRSFIRRAASDAAPNTTNEDADAAALNRFIEFAAEFIPVNPHPPDAEPPEWSLDITAADFGPFAIGRSAVSRARSLAMIAVLSQVDDSEANHRPNFDEN